MKTPTELINRELSIIQFNRRILAQAQNPDLPLLERLRYLCIVSSNLDEFFETRYANLKIKYQQNTYLIDECGQSVATILHSIHEQIGELVNEQYICYEEITSLLSKYDVYFYQSFNWNEEQTIWAKDFFINNIMPVLMPITLDPAHPFPLVLNKSLNFAITIDGTDIFGRKPEIIILPAPRSLPRLVHMPTKIANSKYSYVFLSSFIQAFSSLLFPKLGITGCYQFRITRNSDLALNEDLSNVLDLRTELQGHLSTRHLQDAMRLEVAQKMPNHILTKLIQMQDDTVTKQNNSTDIYSYRVNGPVNLVRLLPLIDELNLPELKFSSHVPKYPSKLKEISWFNHLKKQDVLLHLPYESFDPLLDFINQAIQDKDVVSIQMTLYRTGQNSPIIQALIKAAQEGKEVTVIVELLARFDEETNIYSARELERYGVHVVYGVVGYKCHAKLLLITRNEWGKNGWQLKHYAQISTGNYHTKTAKFYTDFCLFTHHEGICNDIHQTIRAITGTTAIINHQHILQSPFNLHNQLLELIKKEQEYAEKINQNFSNKSKSNKKLSSAKNKRSEIIIKVNSLDETQIIEALYKASQAGVKITLIVRGICCLKAGIKGISDNIKVISTLGRFLEHHRIYYFSCDYEQDKNNRNKLYIGSSDLMHRNCFKRIETLVPIYDEEIKNRIIQEALVPHIQHNSWYMELNGYYKLHNTTGLSPQQHIMTKYF
ncbi:MAG: hypothetical protein RLZZ210_1859 [Pseudomonadota bacterium]|jgi:polyphosphate kinase